MDAQLALLRQDIEEFAYQIRFQKIEKFDKMRKALEKIADKREKAYCAMLIFEALWIPEQVRMKIYEFLENMDIVSAKFDEMSVEHQEEVLKFSF